MLVTLTALLLTATPAAQPDSVYALNEAAFVETARHDLETLKQFVGGMRGVMTQLKGNAALFKKSDAVFSPDQKQTLLSAWGSLFGYFSATEGLRHKYWAFVKLAPTDPRHVWGFIVTHTALTALLAHGL